MAFVNLQESSSKPPAGRGLRRPVNCIAQVFLLCFFIVVLTGTGAFGDVAIIGSWVNGTTHAVEAGSNRALLVFTYGENGSTFSTTGVTYGGQAMTKVLDGDQDDGMISYTSAWILNEAGIAAAVSSTIAVTWSTAPDGSAVLSVFLSGVNQTTLTGDEDQDGNDLAATVTTGAISNSAGDMVFVAGTHSNSAEYTVNNSFTEGLESTAGIWADGDAVAGYKAATGADETPSLTSTSTDRQCIIGFVVNTSSILVSKRVAASSDDAEQAAVGSGVDLTSNDLELRSGSVYTGMRFNNVAIPKGATITTAYLDLEAYSTFSTATAGTFYGENADDAATFTTAVNNITDRTKTTASVSWNPISNFTANTVYSSPSLVSIISEITSRSGWASGNDLVILFEYASGADRREISSYDGDAANAPYFHVEYAKRAEWDGGAGTNSWIADANWMDDPPNPTGGEDIVFAGTTQLAVNHNYTAATSYNSFTFASGAGAFTLSGNSITLGGNITNSSSNLQTISTALILSGTRTVTTTSANITLSGVISGSYGLTKSGTATLTLSGSNTYTGATTLSAGTLNINHATAIGTGTFTINGGTIDNTSAGDITLSTNNLHSWAGNVTFTGTHSLNLGTGAGTLTDNYTLTVNGSTFTIGGSLSGNKTLTKAGTGTLTLSGAVDNNSLILTANAGTVYLAKTSSGGVHCIGGGGLTVAGATVYLGGSGNDQIWNNAPVTVNSGTFNMAGFNETIDNLGGSGGYVDITGGGSSTLTVGNNNGSGTYSGIIQNTSGTLALTKTGTGTQTLSGTSTYTGATTISAGTLQIGNGTTDGSIATSSGITNNSALIFNTLGSKSYSLVISGTGTCTKSGTGTLTLSGTSTYTGTTTLSAGTLLVTGATNSGSAVTVNSGGTLGGGTWAAPGVVAGTVAVNDGGTVAPGIGGTTIGKLTTGAVTFSTTSTYSVDLDGATPTSDQINSTGVVALGTTNTLTVASIANSAITDVYTIISGTSVTGTFNGKAEASTFWVSGVTLRINYPGTSVTLTDVSAAAILGSWVNGTTHAVEAGINRALIVFVYGEHTTDFSATGVTYGTQAMTKIVDRGYAAGNYSYTGAWILNEAGIAAASSSTIAVTWGVTPSVGSTVESVFLSNVYQDAPIGGTASNGLNDVTDITTDALTNSSGDMVFVAGTGENNDSYTVNNGFTEAWEYGGPGHDAVAGYKAATGAPETPSLTLSIALRQTIIGFVVKYNKASKIWNGGGGTSSWITDANWTGGPYPTAGEEVVFAGNTQLAVNHNHTAATSYNSIIWNSGAGAFTLSGNSITLGGSIINNAANLQTISLDMALSGTRTVTAASGNITLSGILSGSYGLNKAGAGYTLTLSGTNTYTGPTTVQAGTLKAGIATAAFGSNSAVFMDNIASASLDITGYDNTIGSLNGGGGIGGNVILGAATLTTGGDATNTSYLGVISGTGGLTKAGTGNVFILAGTNTYTGATTVNKGTIRAGIATQAYGLNSAVTLANAAATRIDLNDYSNTIGSLSGGGTNGGGVYLGAGTLTTGGNNTSTTFAGIIAETGGLTKTGSGTFTLSGTSTYTGATTISNGTLQIGNGTTDGSIATSSGITNNAALIYNIIGTQTYANVIDGTGTLTKTGTGTLTLSGTSTYIGTTTVSAGTLLVTGAMNSGSAVAVNSGGTLGGTGTVAGAITVNGGGTIAPGNGGAGTLNTGALTLGTTSVLTYECAAPAGTSDKIVVNGAIALSGTINITNIGGFAAGTYTLMTYTTTVSGGLAIGTFPATFGGVISTGGGNVTLTVSDVITPTWTRTSLTPVNGGSITPSSLYIGTGSGTNAIVSLNLATGATLWSYTTASACRMPTYMWDAGLSQYKIVATAGNYLVGVLDNGSNPPPVLWAARDLGATPGNPYVSPDDLSILVLYNNTISRRSLADGATTMDADFPYAIPNASVTADMVVMNDEVYVASTDGKVTKVDYDGTPIAIWNGAGSKSIELPLLAATVADSLLYVFPKDDMAYAIKTSTMTTSGTWTYLAADENCGPAFMSFDGHTRSGVIYCAAGAKIYKLTEGSANETWAYTIPDGRISHSGPIEYNGKIYFGTTDSSYFAITDAPALISKWPYPMSSGNASSGPWIDPMNGKMIFGTTGGRVDAFPLQ